MPDVELAHRPGVELVNAGSWQLLSGSWNPNRKDILAAVEAAQCSAVRRPKLKLGHLDPRFNTPEEPQFDGTPSLGWFDNLRASDDGNTLIGDQVALPWLNAVQAAAYPDRSIEGKHNTRCALGHLHPFVITAVSLLGETPPGIPTLRSIKSIDDLPAALGVAASGEDLRDGDSVQATVRAAVEPTLDGDSDEDDEHTGAMVALIPTAEDAHRLAVDGGEPADQLHVTLAYLGAAADLGAQGQQDVIDAVSAVVNGMPVIDADVFSVNVFNPASGNPPEDARDRDTCLVWGLSGDLLDAVHDIVDQALVGLGSEEQHRPWHAHMTAAYTGDLSQIPVLAERVGPVAFDRIRLAFGGQVIDIPLIDVSDEDAPVYADDEIAAAAPDDDDELKRYWLTGDGLKRWANKPHPWRTLYKLLLPHLKDPEKAKRVASAWYRDHFGHMPNQGVKATADGPTRVLAGRHNLPEFEEDKHKRDGNGKFATTWGGGGLKQDGKLGSRIKLGPGETLAGGASIPQAGVAMAAIDSPDGRKLRLGLNIDDGDINRWSGAAKGHTVVLDQPGVDNLRDAITQMQDGAAQGKAALKVFAKTENSLQAQEQKLLSRQYPNLSAKQSAELGTVVRDLGITHEQLRNHERDQQARLDAITDEDARAQAHTLDAEITAARESGDRGARVDAEKRMRELLVKHGEYTDITAMMYARNDSYIADKRAQVSRLQARQAELTANPVALSDADQAELVQVRTALARNDDQWAEFNDGGYLAAGTIPAEWGDIRWSAVMASDDPRFSLAVVPNGAAEDASAAAENEIDAAELKKLAALLDKVSAHPDVKAGADPALAADVPLPADGSAAVLPAAEPEQVINPDPKEDLVSTDLSVFRSRLGLDDTADEQAILSAVDALKAKAEAPVEPTPEMVAASAAATEQATKAEAEKDELRKEVQVLASQMQQVTTELSAAKAAQAATVKASVFDTAIKDGKLKPADREQWEKDYDEAPGAVTRVLASIAPGTAVPVMASGITGAPEPTGSDDDWDAIVARIDAPKAV